MVYSSNETTTTQHTSFRWPDAMQKCAKKLEPDSILSRYPPELNLALSRLADNVQEIYFSGGTLRDLLLSRKPADLDITVPRGAVKCCRRFMEELGGGTFVPLGTETEEAARVVWRGFTVDFSSFRKNAVTIEEELQYRDFTINSMAVRLPRDGVGSAQLIDPLGGCEDLQNGLLRCCPSAFVDDPLRILRGFRLYGELGFDFESRTLDLIGRHRKLIVNSAAERIKYEMDRVMASPAAAKVMKLMADTGVLWQIIPELEDGVGLKQPGYHHVDVFLHNLLALEQIEDVFSSPEKYFHNNAAGIREYLNGRGKKEGLRWAALFHDLGKPATYSSGTMEEDRITFYNHDRVGGEIFSRIAERLRWSRSETERVGSLVEMHMHPFHLSNVRRKQKISRKALLRIYKKAGEDLPGLFVLAMADSLAGQGELKPQDMEEELSFLFQEVQEAVEKYIRPALTGERLITGNDLKEIWGLTPGPMFKNILDGVELARVEAKVGNREEAIQWIAGYLESRNETNQQT